MLFRSVRGAVAGWYKAVDYWKKNPDDADRIMAVQLLGTGGAAALLLLSEATGVPAAVDVALILALLAAFVSVAFVESAPRGGQ